MAEFIMNSIARALSVIVIQLQFICIVVPLCLNSVACRFINFVMQLHARISRFPKALLHYSFAAVCPSLATRCLEEAVISFGLHLCLCSLSHSAASFSITCEMVASGPALHELRYGATCYFQLVFHFALLICHTLWLHSASSFSILCRL